MDIRDVLKPRRIVTGLREDGTSYLARVEEVEPVDYPYVLPRDPGTETASATRAARGGGYFRIWAGDQLPVPLPTDGGAPILDSEPTAAETPEALRRAGACPPPLGMRIAWVRNVGATPPGELHWHDTTDTFFMMSGERGQILDSGEEFILRAGDVQVQNATNHAHEPLGEEPCVMGFVVVGGLRAGPHPPAAGLHPVQRGPIGGHRAGERRDKEPMEEWTAPKPAPGTYAGEPRGPLPIGRIVEPRRVIIGQWEGVAHVARAETAGPGVPIPGDAAPGEHFPIWGADRLPVLYPTPAFAPPLVPPPALGHELDALAEMSPLPPPLGYRAAERGPFHWRDGMDVTFVMGGRVLLVLDGGEELELQPGDCLIDNGSNHAWHNRFDEPAILGVAGFGGVRLGVAPPLADRHPLQRDLVLV